MVKARPLYKKNHLLLAEMMRRGFTLKSLADAVGVHYLTIWRIVNRQHRPTVQTAQRIAELLQESVARLALEPWGDGGEPERRRRQASLAAASDALQARDTADREAASREAASPASSEPARADADEPV